MKMLAFVISLGVLYWAMTSYAHVRLAAGDPCAGPANVSSIGQAAAASAGPDLQVAQIDPSAAGAPICVR